MGRDGSSVLTRVAGGLLALAILGVLIKGWTASAVQPNYGFSSEATPSGWLITDVAAGGPADVAGVRVGDHVVRVDGQDTSDPTVGSEVQIGQHVTLGIAHASAWVSRPSKRMSRTPSGTPLPHPRTLSGSSPSR